MQDFFNYSTIDVVLLKSTRTLAIYLNRPDFDNEMNLEMLFELESILSWCSGRVEIKSLLIGSRTDGLSVGMTKSQIKSFDVNKLERIITKTQKLTNALLHLPQTVVFDLGDNCHNLASELAIGADIRICNVNINMSFNHTHMGIVPCAGGLGFLSAVVGNTYARNWLLNGTRIPIEALVASGFIANRYESSNQLEVLNHILETIDTQASIPRIQVKFGLLHHLIEKSQEALKFENQIARAALITGDWQKADEEFTNARTFKNEARLKLKKEPEETF